MPVEIRRDDKGQIDEIVADNATIHLERMTADSWFLSVTGDDGVEECIWLRRKKRSVVVDLHETRKPRPVRA